jgi:hypothetical protein
MSHLLTDGESDFRISTQHPAPQPTLCSGAGIFFFHNQSQLGLKQTQNNQVYSSACERLKKVQNSTKNQIFHNIHKYNDIFHQCVHVFIKTKSCIHIQAFVPTHRGKERVEGMWVQSGEVTHNDRTRSLTELSESKPNCLVNGERYGEICLVKGGIFATTQFSLLS